MAKAELRWVDGETPRSKVLCDAPVQGSERADDIQKALERIKAFEERLAKEAADRPLVLVDR
jgi:hypothetical protein